MRPIGIAVALCLAGPVSVLAAGADPQSPTPAETRPAVVVEEVKHDLVLGPEVKFTQVNDRDATLVGGYAGILMDKSLLVGAAGYGLANGTHRFRMAYGGGLVEWYLFSRRAIDVSIRGLLGGGTARVAHAWNASAADHAVNFGHHGTRVWADGTRGPLRAVVDVQFIGKDALNRANSEWAAARSLVGASLSYVVTPGARVTLEGKNLGDSRVTDFFGFPLPGRSVVLSVQAGSAAAPRETP